jgi:hypothetical protein
MSILSQFNHLHSISKGADLDNPTLADLFNDYSVRGLHVNYTLATELDDVSSAVAIRAKAGIIILTNDWVAKSKDVFCHLTDSVAADPEWQALGFEKSTLIDTEEKWTFILSQQRYTGL